MLRWLTLCAALGLAACSSGGPTRDEPAVPSAITVTSPAFADGQAIPARFSCDGDDVAPALRWSGVPAGAAELALVVDDPDAPSGTFVHWVLFGLDPATSGLEEGRLPSGARQARNSRGDAAWTGPCPPAGKVHHYRFTLYALGRRLDLADGADPQAALDAIDAAASAQGRLTGTFQR